MQTAGENRQCSWNTFSEAQTKAEFFKQKFCLCWQGVSGA